MTNQIPAPHDSMVAPLTSLHPGMQVLVGGDRLVRIPDEIVARFQYGDRLLVVGEEVLLVPGAVHRLVSAAIDGACSAFAHMRLVEDAAITRFYDRFAARLADDAVWSDIAAANAADVRAAQERGRSTTRLAVSERMREAMIRGLAAWQAMPSPRRSIVETIDHRGWRVERVIDALGVVGFVFEGRPNVFADATGVLRTGNTAVLRIGSDALRTAQAIAETALAPALHAAGLPNGAVSLVASADRAAGWAMFSDPRLALAVARGSGRAVAQLGAVARQSGIPVSLHGAGGAWLVADVSADVQRLYAAVFHSLDRKVCNTANVIVLPAARAAELAPIVLTALRARGEALGHGFKLHVVEGAEQWAPAALFATTAPMLRAEGPVEEPIAEPLPLHDLGREWEWEYTPEVSLAVVADLNEAITLFNTYSPRLAASLIGADPQAQARFFQGIDAPFVGNGMTRWVDGQYALDRPELGLSNWEHGRLFGRGGILSGDGVFTMRYRAVQDDPDLHR